MHTVIGDSMTTRRPDFPAHQVVEARIPTPLATGGELYGEAVVLALMSRPGPGLVAVEEGDDMRDQSGECLAHSR